MFIKLLAISVLFMIFSVVLLGIRAIFRRNGKFPEMHISSNKEMQKRGITCAKETDIGCSPSDDSGGCSTCGKVLL